MGSLIETLVDLVVCIWQGDSEMHDSSIFGESPMARKDRKVVGWICGSVIALLIAVGMIWYKYNV